MMLPILAPINASKEIKFLKSGIQNDINHRLPITETIRVASFLDPSPKKVMLKQLGENDSQ